MIQSKINMIWPFIAWLLIYIVSYVTPLEWLISVIIHRIFNMLVFATNYSECRPSRSASVDPVLSEWPISHLTQRKLLCYQQIAFALFCIFRYISIYLQRKVSSRKNEKVLFEWNQISPFSTMTLLLYLVLIWTAVLCEGLSCFGSQCCLLSCEVLYCRKSSVSLSLVWQGLLLNASSKSQQTQALPETQYNHQSLINTFQQPVPALHM